jgi:hypothetical protein
VGDWFSLGSSVIGAAAQVGKPAALPPMQGGNASAGQNGSGWVVNFGKGALVGSSGGSEGGGFGGISLEWLLAGVVVYLLVRR